MVRNAAKLAVYDEIIIRVKNHQKVATVRDELALKINRKILTWFISAEQNMLFLQTENYTHRGKKSQPCCTHDAIENHKQWCTEANGVTPSSLSNSNVS